MRGRREPVTSADIAGLPVFVSIGSLPGEVCVDFVVRQDALANLLPYSCLRTFEPGDAIVMATDDISKLDFKRISHWVMALRGLHVLHGNPDVVQASVKYEPALVIARQLYISPRFCEKHPHVAAILKLCVRRGAIIDFQAKPAESWAIIPDEASFLACKLRTASSRKDATILGLVLREESKVAPFAGVKHVFAANALLRFITIIAHVDCFFGR